MSKNLKKKTIAITRPYNRIDEAQELVESYGGEAFIVPTLELKLKNTDSLKNLVELVSDLDWLIFTSPTSIESIFKFYPDFREKLNPNCKIAAIGHKTEEVANSYDLRIDLIPKDYTAEGLLKSFEKINVNNSIIGIPRTLAARDTLPEGLKKLGADVVLAESYESIIPQDTSKIEILIAKILKSEIDAITFTSPLTAENLFKIATEERASELAKKLSTSVLSVAIGPITSKTLENLGVNPIYPKIYTVKDMMKLLFENL